MYDLVRRVRSRLAAGLLLGMAVSGCAPATTNVAPAVAPSPPPRVAARAVSPTVVKLFAGFAPTEPRLVLGAVTVNVRGDALQAAAALKRAAGKMGADAVVQMKLTKAGDISRTSLSGLAVRFAP